MFGCTVDLSNFFLNELVSLLADGDDLLAGNAELRNGSKNLLGDRSGGFPFCKVVWVRQGVIYIFSKSAQLSILAVRP